jgi:hypothetical protein
MKDLNADLLHRLGEHLLREAGRKFTKVDRVEIHYSQTAGYSEDTPAGWDYSVHVYYDSDKAFSKIYDFISPIIQLLEKIDRDVQEEGME